MKKSYDKSGSTCRVTFKLPGEVETKGVWLCGDFNDWDPEGMPMRQLKDGSWSRTVVLKTGEYRFRYRLADGRWENDWAADAYVANPYGGKDSIVQV